MLPLGYADIADVVEGHLGLPVLVPADNVGQIPQWIDKHRSQGKAVQIDEGIRPDPLWRGAHGQVFGDLACGAEYLVEAGGFLQRRQPRIAALPSQNVLCPPGDGRAGQKKTQQKNTAERM